MTLKYKRKAEAIVLNAKMGSQTYQHLSQGNYKQGVRAPACIWELFGAAPGVCQLPGTTGEPDCSLSTADLLLLALEYSWPFVFL